ncbi:MAG: 3'-5' exonuclease [Bacteroidales bacterium]|nr:3'-5' exonuclease [Bacteroidales bacterium]
MKFVVSVILFLSIGFAYAGPNYLFFDTETTGLPHDYEAPAFDTLNWPRMVQLSWILTDNKGNVLSTHDYIIRPDGYEIPEESASIHGISTEKAMLEGLPLDSVLVVFAATLDSAEYIVGHNISFDIHVVDAEFFRRGVDVQLSSMKSYCTMLAGTDYCKLPGRYGHYKWPKLQELHKILFGVEFDGAHNSAADVEATCKCFWEMRRRKII